MESRKARTLSDPENLINSSLEKVFQYENPQLQFAALSLIPEEKMRQKAASCEDHSRPKRDDSGETSNECELCYLQTLASWFKSDFFSWVNSPDCERCGGKTHFISRYAQPWPIDKSLLPRVNRPPYVIDVENHQCTTCGSITKFPRHTDASILLDTRKGRCSEWAQVFTLMCRALGYRARYVVDVTDHVWTEVFSRSRNRWMHIDSCEAAVDQSLLYEKGWGKQLSYIIGVGVDDVQDVSWRYSADHRSLRGRRDPRLEKSLVNLLVAKRKSIIARLAPEAQKNIMRSVVAELIELMTEPVSAEDEELGGRTSGDQQWIRSRGEDGGNAGRFSSTVKLLEKTDVSKLTVCPIQVQVSYSAARDLYTLTCIDQHSNIEKWQKLTFSSENILRKEETDWKMAYLARKTASKPGIIEWKFDAKPLRIDSIAINAGAFVKDGCEIHWEIESCDRNFKASFVNADEISTKILMPCDVLTVRVTLISPPGSHSIAWQHAQLFRESMTEPSASFGFTVGLNTIN